MKRLVMAYARILLAVVSVALYPTTGRSRDSTWDAASTPELSNGWVETDPQLWYVTYLTPYNTYVPDDKFALSANGASTAWTSRPIDSGGHYYNEDVYLLLSVGAIMLGGGIIVVSLVGWLRRCLV